MGYLLKEALKSICGVNQWSYAVFWKIGCQNPKLLIWEDCYCEVMPCSVIPCNTKIENQGVTLEELDKCWLSPEAYPNQLRTHLGDRVDLLVKKMMANQVHVVGEGLVGRTAFTGNHQWIVSGYFHETIHPPEVVNEVRLQFSSGMQTVAVIPAIPHGVIQLGSSLAIMESTGFIHDVKTLILHLGSVPRALVSDNYVQDAYVETFGMPFTPVGTASLSPYGNANNVNCSAIDSAMQPNLFHGSQLADQATHSLSSKVQNNLKTTASTIHIRNRNVCSEGNECQSSKHAEADSFLNCETPYNPGSGPSRGQSLLLASDCSDKSIPGHIVLGAGHVECTQPRSVPSGSVFHPHLRSHISEPYDGWASGAEIVNFSNRVVDDFPVVGDQPIVTCVLPGCLHVEDDLSNYKGIAEKREEIDMYKGVNMALPKERDHVVSRAFPTECNEIRNATEVPSCLTSMSDINSSVQGDLFDVLGIDYKNQILNGYACKFSNTAKNTAEDNMIDQVKSQDLTSMGHSDSHRISESGKFSAPGTDQLLGAMVSGVYSAATQTSDDNVSCKTTLTKASSGVPGSSLMFGQGSIAQQMCELFGPSKTSVRSSETGASLTVLPLGKNDSEISQVSSFYGSQSSSWVEQGSSMKLETSIATANSKKSGEVGKPSRKRLKPGENPRPRPKDRQMIQDRVKELRDIVPNGAKCSIDALLERTIKHMLFLQSVTQHADTLKQTVESKIINKDGGLPLKDNFEGGATWAYEVGSRSRVCPIVVEDLNAARQLLVEMLCEEKGFFLEIADIIRGMGLTILKGVMETRHDKIWARFAVEANRDVTRMEIFMSLAHLLEQTEKNNGGKKDGSNTINGVLHMQPSTAQPLYQESK